MALSNKVIQQNLLDRIEELARNSWDGELISLQKAAEKRNIKEVVFRRLLTGAALLMGEDDFLVYIRAPAHKCKEWNDIYKADDKRLPVRQRFSLAHEISHTFFYEKSSSKDDGAKEHIPVRRKPKKELTDIEEVLCNKMASALQIPRFIMEPIARPWVPNDWVPAYLRVMSNRFRVSADTFVIRLNDFRSILRFDGLAAVLRKTSEGYKWGPQYCDKSLVPPAFRNLERNSKVDSSLFPQNCILFGGKDYSGFVDVPITGRPNGEAWRFNVNIEPEAKNEESSLIVVFNRV